MHNFFPLSLLFVLSSWLIIFLWHFCIWHFLFSFSLITYCTCQHYSEQWLLNNRWMCKQSHRNWKLPLMSEVNRPWANRPEAEVCINVFVHQMHWIWVLWHCLFEACEDLLWEYPFGWAVLYHSAHLIFWSCLLCIQSKGSTPIHWFNQGSCCAC